MTEAFDTYRRLKRNRQQLFGGNFGCTRVSEVGWLALASALASSHPLIEPPHGLSGLRNRLRKRDQRPGEMTMSHLLEHMQDEDYGVLANQRIPGSGWLPSWRHGLQRSVWFQMVANTFKDRGYLERCNVGNDFKREQNRQLIYGNYERDVDGSIATRSRMVFALSVWDHYHSMARSLPSYRRFQRQLLEFQTVNQYEEQVVYLAAASIILIAAASVPLQVNSYHTWPSRKHWLRSACYMLLHLSFPIQDYHETRHRTRQFREEVSRQILPPDDFDQSLALRWRTSDVVGLCRAIMTMPSETEARLPILGDALMDAGCDDELILTLCRQAPEMKTITGYWWLVDWLTQPWSMRSSRRRYQTNLGKKVLA